MPLLLASIAICDSAVAQPHEFTITVSNIATPETPFAISPSPLGQSVWVVHRKKNPFFTENQPVPPNGLEVLAEDGHAYKIAAGVQGLPGVTSIGTFPEKQEPIEPGESVRFTIIAKPGDKLSLAMMLVQSNDKFYAPDGKGIALFKRKKPLTGDVSDQFILWDAGSEIDQTPGKGKDQPLRQKKPHQGEDQNGIVRRINDGVAKSQDGFAYPAAIKHIRVIIE